MNSAWEVEKVTTSQGPGPKSSQSPLPHRLLPKSTWQTGWQAGGPIDRWKTDSGHCRMGVRPGKPPSAPLKWFLSSSSLSYLFICAIHPAPPPVLIHSLTHTPTMEIPSITLSTAAWGWHWGSLAGGLNKPLHDPGDIAVSLKREG